MNCIVKEYEDEDAALLDLLEANVRRRGDVGGSQKKFGRRIKELERLYGVRQGSAGISIPVTGMGQKELADKYRMKHNKQPQRHTLTRQARKGKPRESR